MLHCNPILAGLAIMGCLTLPAAAAELVMVEQDGCHWCAKWNAEIAPIYPKTDVGQLAPLRRVDLHDLPDDIAFETPPIFTPSFVLVEDGQELARMEGYAGDEFFWYLLEDMFERNADRITDAADTKVTQ